MSNALNNLNSAMERMIVQAEKTKHTVPANALLECINVKQFNGDSDTDLKGLNVFRKKLFVMEMLIAFAEMMNTSVHLLTVEKTSSIVSGLFCYLCLCF